MTYREFAKRLRALDAEEERDGLEDELDELLEGNEEYAKKYDRLNANKEQDRKLPAYI